MEHIATALAALRRLRIELQAQIARIDQTVSVLEQRYPEEALPPEIAQRFNHVEITL